MSRYTAAIRVDASAAIGAGHLMRCLTLADDLRDVGFDVIFVSRAESASALDLVMQRDFEMQEIGNKADGWEDDARHTLEVLSSRAPVDWLVVDHYGLDRRWESRLRVAARRILVIDDLANRHHDCDALLDQNYYRDGPERYRELVCAECRLFLGPGFALLRKEFRDLLRSHRARDGTVRQLLVSFGATDPTDETSKVLAALHSSEGIVADVVIGRDNPRHTDIMAKCTTVQGVRCHVQTSHMGQLMYAADLAIGAGGSSTWERCALGLPALTVVTAANQLQTTMDLDAIGAIWYIGRGESLTAHDYARALNEAIRNPERLRDLSERARETMGSAVAALATGRHPVVESMFEQTRGP